ncbi:hypothetical protein RDV89_08685 [Nocardioides zeae]|uniref:Uncharacterized protein n=1 Tax=Nocardioides imazamoxiresistens TaxID=3231893 RepID=A0ABU3PWD2_9ACTN|nr:hypothetical protein [Nocardioides zeae]MDT9593142.1 hypothetical protein [Nocardioides zeae]
MATRPQRSEKTFDMMKLAICVGIGVALGIVFDNDPLGVPSLAIGPALGVVVARIWTKADRARKDPARA